jgi:hypothetical protein
MTAGPLRLLLITWLPRGMPKGPTPTRDKRGVRLARCWMAATIRERWRFGPQWTTLWLILVRRRTRPNERTEVSQAFGVYLKRLIGADWAAMTPH